MMENNVNSCTDCGLVFDSSKSLDVHLSYHKETLMSKWGSASGSEDNNNVKKRPDVRAPADSSDFLFDFQEPGAFQRLPRTQYRYHPYGYDRQVTSNAPDLGGAAGGDFGLGQPQGARVSASGGGSAAAFAPSSDLEVFQGRERNSSPSDLGHLKRHYNTTLHKNAVKQSGGVDPATMPVSTHHHPQVEEYHPAPPRMEIPPPRMEIPPPRMEMPQIPMPAPQIQPDYGYHYGYHPNGNPPHGANLPSFSQLTGVNYEPVGGVYHDKEAPTVSSTVTSAEPTKSLHKCVDCDKTFNKACYLTQHNKSFHAGDKPFKCSRCGKRFTQEYLHLEHLSKHAGDKPYKCEMCPKQFNHKTDLRRHMCLHSGDKPYVCSYCGKGFIRKDHMLKHAETHKKKQSFKNEFRL
ncbi:hypothetical protein GE061_007732 [Apolygus lucorum]|uniref:C2H2-type domain-containing protein n=1 Tax=Apolygus lucorum TaxID=248454 RepID=A0A8S9WMJ8_APOLU|nr:hypothetical protein GE061_007732 [Apolygus lucorum]